MCATQRLGGPGHGGQQRCYGRIGHGQQVKVGGREWGGKRTIQGHGASEFGRPTQRLGASGPAPNKHHPMTSSGQRGA